ncbi:hypothetical protein [Bordetella sp. 2513F-2]
MRVLFLLIVLANVWAYALGQGWLGVPPNDEGRNPARLAQELNAGQVSLTTR